MFARLRRLGARLRRLVGDVAQGSGRLARRRCFTREGFPLDFLGDFGRSCLGFGGGCGLVWLADPVYFEDFGR
jgi:hypothetical protein